MSRAYSDPWLMLSPSRGEDRGTAADFLQIEAIENVLPLDRQFGVSQQKKSVPDALKDILFGELSPTEAEIASAVVAPMQTYAIIDAAKIINLAELLETSQLEHRCLFKGNAYEEMRDVAPWIVKLDINNDFTRRLFTGREGINGLWEAESGIYVRSRGTLEEMWRHFRKFTRVQGADDKTYFFRYWSHHVFLAWMMESRKTMSFARSFFNDQSNVNLRTIMAYDAVGLVTFTFRSLNSFRQPFVRRPRGFCRLTTSAAVVDYRTH